MDTDWKNYKLGDLFVLSNQGVNTTTENVKYSDAGRKVIRAKNISPYKLDFEDIVFVDDETFNKLKEPVKPDNGDILYTNIGSQLGSAAVVSIKEKFAIAWNVFRIKPNQKLVDSRFLTYLFNNSQTRDYVRSLNSSSTMPFVSGKVLRDIEITLPTIRTQKTIAHILGTFDDKIELNRQMNATLEAMAQALFKSWFVDFDPVIDNALAAGHPIPEPLHARAEARKALGDKCKPLPKAIQKQFPSRFVFNEEMGWVPEGWGVQPLDRIANYQNGLALQKFRPENDDDYLPVVKIAQLKKGWADGEEKASPNIKPECIIDDGDIVFSWSGSLMVDVWCGGKAALNQHLFKVTSQAHPKWLYYQFTNHHLHKFQRIAADKAVTMGHIKREHLSQAFCAVPNNAILNAIGGTFDGMMLRAIASRVESHQLAKLRDTLLPKLLSGQLRIPDAEKLIQEAV